VTPGLKARTPCAARVAGPTVLVVHAHCADGLTSAGLLLRRVPEARVVYAQPAELRTALERLADEKTLRRVILADLSPQAADLEAILQLLSRLRSHGDVTWLDHHAPQWPAAFEKSVRDLGVEVRLDRTGTESGASLVAQWTNEKDPALRRVADLIRLRDAWVRPHDPDARAWTLVATELEEDYVRALATGRLEGLEEKGRALLAEKEASIARSLAEVRRHSPEVAYLWGEDDVSDVADRLFRTDPRVVFLLRFGPSARVSIRSRSDRPVAATLGQRFGGGGHANAAGFSLGMGWGRRLWLRLRRASDPAVRRALEAAQEIAAKADPTPRDRRP
jgi:oligoribonuclease NrnB/cAMP/cGMP phosphodiesterase (DHH superfamily)